MPNSTKMSRDLNLYEKKWILDYSGDPTKVQLLFCVNRTGGEPAGGQKCASPSGGSVEMYDATYRMRVIEARTGRQLKEWMERAVFTQCPEPRVMGDENDSGKYYADIPSRRLSAILEEYITPQAGKAR
ncbi:hypothetical protein ACFV0B_24475 [Streptomyces xanthophaeus]|uniref:hypothetical protein n=1 Tax=Streptomyces xanthophaeus TaxID=67385 RepID=UPI0036ADA09E